MATVRRQTAQPTTWRLLAIAIGLGLATMGLLSRLAYLQIVDHGAYAAQAQSEHDTQATVPAQRGALLDANGLPLASSVPVYDVVLDRKIWGDAASAQRDAAVLAPLLQQSPDEILTLDQTAIGPTVLAAHGLDYDTGQHIIALGLPGVLANRTAQRNYPEGDLASNVLGFVGRDGKGLAGLELDLDPLLSGKAGSSAYERDSLGNPIAFGANKYVQPQPGSDVMLTIDRNIQKMAEDSLSANVAKTHATGGTVIVMDPATGALLAMASEPSFRLSGLDINNLQPKGDYLDHAVSDSYEPGSVFKLITMSAAINEGKVNPNTTYMDTGSVVVAGRVFHNWDYSTNGPTTMTTLLVRSLNLGSLWVSTKVLGPELFYKYVRAFGFGELTGAGLGGETAGIVRTNAQASWSLADLASNSFGQGISVSALQLCDAIAAIANGGNLMTPYVVKEVRGPDGADKITQPQVRSHPITPETAATIRTMMKEVNKGYPQANIPGYTAGVKSGTAYVPTNTPATSAGDAYADEITIPSFVGFAPFNNPRVLIYVKLDNLHTNDFGGTLGAPMFAQLASQVLPYLNVAPDASDTTAAVPGR